MQIEKYNILDFSDWLTEGIDEPLGKLLKGLREFYGDNAGDDDGSD